MGSKKHPLQPLEKDAAGVLRFKENAIVHALLDFATPRGFGLNEISAHVQAGRFLEDDLNQLGQLIGYSHGGSPSYITDETLAAAWQQHQQGISEMEARYQALLEVLQAILPGLQAAACVAFHRHPDDLQSEYALPEAE